LAGASRIVVFLPLVLTAALGLGACAMQDKVIELSPGDTFTTQSGLTLTIPQGASATVTKPTPDEIQTDVPFTEFLDLEIDDSLAVVLMSFSGTQRNKTDATVVATESDVAVLEPSAESLSAVVETNLKGAAPGRVVIIVPPGSSTDLRGLDLARSTWDRLSVQGATLPASSGMTTPE